MSFLSRWRRGLKLVDPYPPVKVAPLTGRPIPTFGTCVLVASLPAPDKPNIRGCRKDRRNTITYVQDDDHYVSVCQQCGCRHFGLKAEPGLIDLFGAEVNISRR